MVVTSVRKGSLNKGLEGVRAGLFIIIPAARFCIRVGAHGRGTW